MTRSNLRLLVFPVDDESLRRDVEAAVGRLPDETSLDDARVAVQQELRRWYGSVSIRERDTLGGYPDDPARVWYVYRDGRIRRRDARVERLYAALANARVTCASSEAAVAAARQAARAAGYDVELASQGGFEPVGAVRRPASASAER